MIEALQRHDLVWLEPGAHRRAQLAGAARLHLPAALACLADWLRRGHPLIMARQGHDTPRGALRLGLALPPREGQHRLAWHIAAHAVRRASAPPLLGDIRRALPHAWQDRIAALCEHPLLGASAPRVIGSAALAALTGEPCLHAASDLDLLVTVRHWREALDTATALGALSQCRQGPRIDGELRALDGTAVAWREVLAPTAQVLTKSRSGAALLPWDGVQQRWDAAAHGP